jgi:hypothetical protein
MELMELLERMGLIEHLELMEHLEVINLLVFDYPAFFYVNENIVLNEFKIY